MSDRWDIPWSLDVGSFTDVGRVRQRNEDSAKVCSEPPVYAVADGMGGHRAGDRASRIAVDAVHEFLVLASSEGGSPDEDMFRGAYRAANQRIIEDASGRPDRLGMGTTLTTLVLSDEEYWIGHVGDSRALRVRNGSVEQLTDDHSIVAAQVREGGMTEEEARVHPMRHVLSRCMGCEPDPIVDVFHGKVSPGDVFVIASDGLTGPLLPDVIAETVSEAPDADSASRLLVEKARVEDGSDNITAVVVACCAD
jgi:protein phosphatase